MQQSVNLDNDVLSAKKVGRNFVKNIYFAFANNLRLSSKR